MRLKYGVILQPKSGDGEPTSGADGSIYFTVSRSKVVQGSMRNDLLYLPTLLVKAEGHGVEWVYLMNQSPTVRLVKDDVPLEGRILDEEGRPVAGAKVSVVCLKVPTSGDLSAFLQSRRAAAEGCDLKGLERFAESGQGKNRTPWSLMWPDLARYCFPPVTTDADGRFRLTGIGRERLVDLLVQGPTIEQTELRVLTRRDVDEAALSPPAGDDEHSRVTGKLRLEHVPLYTPGFEHRVGPTTPITGTVRDRDTGLPLAGVQLMARPSESKCCHTDVAAVTDENGQYRLIGLPRGQRYRIIAATTTVKTHQQQEQVLEPGAEPVANFELRSIEAGGGPTTEGMTEQGGKR
jgi:hypothetical protein